MPFVGQAGEIARIKRELRALEIQAAQKVKAAAIDLVSTLIDNTPVWEGETVRNYGAAPGNAAIGGSKSAIGNSDPGPTNTMPLGTEPRRGQNAAAALAETNANLARMFNKLMNVTVFNTVSDAKWSLINSGAAPSHDRARYPGGVLLRSVQSVRGRHPDFK